METLQRLYLSLLLILFLVSCETKKEKIEKAANFGFSFYQGKPEHMNAFAYALELDSTNAEYWRELSVTYLKRGIPHIWKKYIDKAVALNPEVWQGYRGYNYLWFYRDYRKAIEDFDAVNALTPNFTDAPQGHSVDYWKGIAYLGLKEYNNAIQSFDKYIAEETENFGVDLIEVTTYLYKGIVYYELQDFDKAIENFNLLLQYSYNTYGDGKYYLALIYKQQGKLKEAKQLANDALKDYKDGYVNQRPYVESMRELYLEDYEQLINQLNNSTLQERRSSNN
ncbi:tetratricopeptide repeat protein [Tenacibaculum amylolyticum]|uniref:tetratricopeptide repeat protein n=1 Tax=Tenacibaculum amylolyticum TaxID=104269 RepID=UPI0038955FBA